MRICMPLETFKIFTYISRKIGLVVPANFKQQFNPAHALAAKRYAQFEKYT